MLYSFRYALFYEAFAVEFLFSGACVNFCLNVVRMSIIYLKSVFRWVEWPRCVPHTTWMKVLLILSRSIVLDWGACGIGGRDVLAN